MSELRRRMTEDLQFVEMQGSGEENTFSHDEMSTMLELSRQGIGDLARLQREAILAADAASDDDLSSLADAFGQT